MATHPLSTETWTGTTDTTHAQPLEKRTFPPGWITSSGTKVADFRKCLPAPPEHAHGAAGQAPSPQEHQPHPPAEDQQQAAIPQKGILDSAAPG